MTAAATNPVSAFLRAEVERIANAWEAEVLVQLPELGRLHRAALIDHLPEFLLGLASWVDGDPDLGRRGFTALAYGHAMTRLGHGITLAALSTEHQVLRRVILRELLQLDSSRHVREALILLNEGMDVAINDSIKLYTESREQVRERFVSILGHDLHNPLHAVALASASIAATPCGEPKHARMAALIQRSAERMMRIISDVIDFAHAQLGDGIPMVPKPCVMGELCEEVIGELRLVHPGRELQLVTSGDTRGHWDCDRLTQLLGNLVSNALNHGADPVVVRVEEAPDRLSVRLRVENRGAAIPTAELATLFDPFRHGRADSSHARERLGLGLFIVRQIALAHGATIDVSSDDDLTAFDITWPRVPLQDLPTDERT